MKPIQPNYKNDLKHIRSAIEDLANVVNGIKQQLSEVNNKVDNVNQLEIFGNPNVSYTKLYFDEEQ
jgi:t-SNARE complex subunit (syntaxin)|tara:strand:- start:399 stop:596 length:198 start_codon:yes stop_codon:yes gene_type:complete